MLGVMFMIQKHKQKYINIMIEIFDKDGKVINLTNVLADFIKEQLHINITIDEEQSFDNKYTKVSVQLLLGDEVIEESYDTFQNN
jgi:hypothetical protein